VPVSFAQPDFGRYTVFAHHFARDGDEIFRLDRQPTMRNHPVTPATESDLRVHLRAQTELPIGAVSWTDYDDPAALSAALAGELAAVVLDALTDAHLDQVAEAVLAAGDAPRFVLGSGGISGALGRAAHVEKRLPALPTTVSPSTDPVLVLSGSASTRTRLQLEVTGWPVLDLFADDVEARATAVLRDGGDVIVSSTLDPQRQVASSEVERRLATVGDSCLRSARVGRMVVCGGDTSSNVLRRLGVTRLAILAQPWGNAPLLRGGSDEAHLDGLELVLKGGQVGHPELLADVKTGTPLAAA
jgi:3-oxoisoapionate kinase